MGGLRGILFILEIHEEASCRWSWTVPLGSSVTSNVRKHLGHMVIVPIGCNSMVRVHSDFNFKVFRVVNHVHILSIIVFVILTILFFSMTLHLAITTSLDIGRHHHNVGKIETFAFCFME